MARFLTPLIVKKRKDNKWELVEKLEYHVGSPNSKEVILVPRGFVTDLASTPWGVRNFFPKDGLYTNAAALHDFLYFQGVKSRKYCDKVFLEAMKVSGVGFIKRRIMYRMVRMFGWAAWKGHRAKEKPSFKP